MEILKIAIDEAGSATALAKLLGVTTNAVTNWTYRNKLPKSWEIVLSMKFKKAIKAHQETSEV